MKLVASYFEPEKAEVACKVLQQVDIPFQTQVTDESGVDETRISVSEEHFERAADVLEKLDEQVLGAEPAKPSLVCPKCGGSEFDYTPHNGQFGEYIVYICRQCKNVVVRPTEGGRRK